MSGKQRLSISSKRREIAVPTRHSRFLPTFMVNNESGVSKVSFKLGKTEDKPLENQRKMPVRTRLAQCGA